MHYLLVDETGQGRHLHPAFRRLMAHVEFIHGDSAHIDLQVEKLLQQSGTRIVVKPHGVWLEFDSPEQMTSFLLTWS
jgi:hypothetical protein